MEVKGQRDQHWAQAQNTKGQAGRCEWVTSGTLGGWWAGLVVLLVGRREASQYRHLELSQKEPKGHRPTHKRNLEAQRAENWLRPTPGSLSGDKPSKESPRLTMYRR
jgi:hypothetical protein